MTDAQRSILYSKFDRDVCRMPRWHRFFIAVDQVFAVLFWNTSQDETISSCIGRRIVAGNATWWDKLICKCLTIFQEKHCLRARGE